MDRDDSRKDPDFYNEDGIFDRDIRHLLHTEWPADVLYYREQVAKRAKEAEARLRKGRTGSPFSG
jgi:hypothetical protein